MKYKVLVNKYNKVKESFFKRINLVEVKNYENENVLIEEETKKAFSDLKGFLKEKGIYIDICCSYMGKDNQHDVYNYYQGKYGYEYAKNIISSLETSEHCTGLAIDIVIKVNDKYIVDKDELLQNEELFLEIHKYLSKFGFILRYPKNKCKITNHHYAPWHIRYVGNIVAEIIYKNDWTLEEYLTEFSGVLVINKEKNMTSRDVVNIVGKTLGIKKIGHTGTLDPLAEGVLVLTIGKATKIGELLTCSYKEYVAEAVLGILTDSLDITGNVLDKKEVPRDINIEAVLQQYQKTYFQEVPSYSAVKVSGKKLYEYARNNEEVILPKKEVTIKEIKILDKSDEYFSFSCLVSKGCYIRSLIRDIGNGLNTYATMTKLTRIKQGNFSIESAYTLNDFLNGKFNVLSIEDVLDYKVIQVNDTMEMKIKNGQKLKNIYKIEDKVIFKNMKGKILGIYEKSSDNKLRTWKNF